MMVKVNTLLTRERAPGALSSNSNDGQPPRSRWSKVRAWARAAICERMLRGASAEANERGSEVKRDYDLRGDRLGGLSPRRFISSLSLACALLASQGPALAQDASELKKARAQFQQATELEQAGNWTAPLQPFPKWGKV